MTYYPQDIPIDPLFIETMFTGNFIGQKVISFVTTESTNDIAWGYARSGDSGLVVLSESQRSGRGRFRDRQWYDTPGCSILMSILLDAQLVAPEILSVVAGVAVSESVRQVSQLDSQIKWPNDIMLNGKKISGVMVESRVIDNKRWYVLGIGLNCNQSQEHFPESISQQATSLFVESGRQYDRNALVLYIMEKLDDILSGKQSRSELAARWLAQRVPFSQSIKLISNGRTYQGMVQNIDPFSGLTVKLDDGTEQFFDAQTSISLL